MQSKIISGFFIIKRPYGELADKISNTLQESDNIAEKQLFSLGQ